MDDISDTFEMKNNQKEGLTFFQINDALAKIAKVHAVAYGYILENPDVAKDWKIPSWYDKFIQDKEFITLVDKCFDNLIRDLKVENKTLIEPVTNLKKRWIQVFKKTVVQKDPRFIIHGDLWINNVMFDSDNNCKILDWQMMSPDHPVLGMVIGITQPLPKEGA